MNRSRAYRRDKLEKSKDRAREILISQGTEPTEKMINRMYRHPKMCSCYMCGNPRKHFGEATFQERKHQTKGIDDA